MSDCFDHALDAFDSYSFDNLQDIPCKHTQEIECEYLGKSDSGFKKIKKVEIVHETKKAFLFRNKRGKFWIPKSRCKFSNTCWKIKRDTNIKYMKEG